MKNAFENIRVLDFTWQVMGPVCTKYLSDFGAEVIKIESAHALDAARGNLPYRDNIPGINRSCHYAWLHTGKRSINLNLKRIESIEIVKKLVSLSDIVIENFTPGTMEKLGLSYEELNKKNPGIIMVRLSGAGQTGPYRQLPAFGNFIAAWSGMNGLLGEADKGPIIGYVPHPDYLGAHMGMIAIIGGLLNRLHTGKGQCIDISMLEASVLPVAPAILDYFVNGNELELSGNRSLYSAPHGIYRCAGEDRWCAISISSDIEWVNFIKAIGSPSWAAETRFDTVRGRKDNEDEIDSNIQCWTANYSAEYIMNLLQSNKIAAGIVQNGKDLINDPQLQYRKHFNIVKGHVELDTHYTSSPAFILSETHAQFKPAPCFGQDNEYVFLNILGLSSDEFVELINSGIIQ